jgi:hypothetical protein
MAHSDSISEFYANFVLGVTLKIAGEFCLEQGRANFL